jgi:hypothetical protein
MTNFYSEGFFKAQWDNVPYTICILKFIIEALDSKTPKPQNPTDVEFNSNLLKYITVLNFQHECEPSPFHDMDLPIFLSDHQLELSTVARILPRRL